MVPLPLPAMMENLVIAHANLIDPGYLGYVRDEDDADLCLTKQSVPVGFIWHVPAIFISMAKESLPRRSPTATLFNPEPKPS